MIPNLKKCMSADPKPPIILSNLTLHVESTGQHSSHANFLIFILTKTGYICFRSDPHGFNNTLAQFKPELLDEYLEDYFLYNEELKQIPGIAFANK